VYETICKLSQYHNVYSVVCLTDMRVILLVFRTSVVSFTSFIAIDCLKNYYRHDFFSARHTQVFGCRGVVAYCEGLKGDKVVKIAM